MVPELQVFDETSSINIQDELEKVSRSLISTIQDKYELPTGSKIQIVHVFLKDEGRILISAFSTKADGSATTQSDVLFKLR